MDRVKEITDKIPYVTVATANESGLPWNSPVWSFHDTDYTYYWCSGRNSQHSCNIRANGYAFIVVYDSTVPEGQGEGVYIQAVAQEITDPTEITDILAKRAKIRQDQVELIEFQGEAPRRWYKATPQKIWLNKGSESNGYFVDVREQVL